MAHFTVRELLDRAIPTGLSPNEMARVADLDATRLAQWYKRSWVPDELQSAPGHGNARRYTLDEVKLLAVMRSLADLGVTVAEAGRIATELLKTLPLKEDRTPHDMAALLAHGHGAAIYSVEFEAWKRGWASALVAGGHLEKEVQAIMKKNFPEHMAFDVVLVIPRRGTSGSVDESDPLVKFASGEYLVLALRPGDSIESRLRRYGFEHCIVIDVAMVLMRLYSRLAEVLESRARAQVKAR